MGDGWIFDFVKPASETIQAVVRIDELYYIKTFDGNANLQSSVRIPPASFDCARGKDTLYGVDKDLVWVESDGSGDFDYLDLRLNNGAVWPSSTKERRAVFWEPTGKFLIWDNHEIQSLPPVENCLDVDVDNGRYVIETTNGYSLLNFDGAVEFEVAAESFAAVKTELSDRYLAISESRGNLRIIEIGEGTCVTVESPESHHFLDYHLKFDEENRFSGVVGLAADLEKRNRSFVAEFDQSGELLSSFEIQAAPPKSSFSSDSSCLAIGSGIIFAVMSGRQSRMNIM